VGFGVGVQEVEGTPANDDEVGRRTEVRLEIGYRLVGVRIEDLDGEQRLLPGERRIFRDKPHLDRILSVDLVDTRFIPSGRSGDFELECRHTRPTFPQGVVGE